MPNNEVTPLKPALHLSLDGAWQFRQSGHDNWLPAKVPGCNFSDLLANNVINDPFYRDEEHQLQWIEQESWEYRKLFSLTAEMLILSDIELVVEGLDTYCNVYINQQLLHENSNMFVGHRLACKSLLHAGDNEILIVFRSPIKEVLPTFVANGFTYPAENDKSEERLSVFTRKAPYHYGWDWGPRFVTSGIWRSIHLEGINKSRIENVYIQQKSLSDDSAHLVFQLSLANIERFKGSITIHCDNVTGIDKTLSVEFTTKTQVLEIPLIISNPQRWWPNGLGEAFLHQFTVTLHDEQQVLHRQTLTFGLRTIEVINEADDYGESFYLKVNGHPTFMKGANYIPSDSLLDRVDQKKYEQIFDDAVNANMNMLRVWGGGIYENDEFYRLADQRGILVWQDFMFACSLYPADENFINNVVQEIEYNVKRLRNHACIALWCGNNETEMGIEFWHWPKTFNYSDELYQRLKTEYDLLFKQVLPDTLAKFDADRFYFSSSPIGFWENKSDDNRGDNHYWGVWHGEEPFSEFKNRVPRFMSEYGFQSFPILDSVKQYSVEEDWHLGSSVMKTHQKHPRGNSLISQYMDDEYQKPKDFESFLYLSQVQQALGMKIAFEAHRSAMPFCMGSLYWQFNDCWPVASWSGIDYYGRWKALHYQAKRSFEPVTVFADECNGMLNIIVVSDLLTRVELQLEQQLISLSGKVLWSSVKTVNAPPLSSTTVETHSLSNLLASHEKESLVHLSRISQIGTKVPDTNYEMLHYFVPTKALKLQQPSYVIATDYLDEKIYITLMSNTLARQVHLTLDENTENFSDNFFDLLPNTEKKISLSVGKRNEDEVALLIEKLTIMSIVDTY